MKRKLMKRIKINTINAFALFLTAIILTTPLVAYAAFVQPGLVNGDGVRLRKTPGINGAVLGLMYRGEKITLSDEIDHDYPAWVYLRREKNQTVGWMEWSYFIHDWESES